MVSFRKFETTSGKKVFLGKSAENNEELIKQVESTEIVLHTAWPGSPFCNIKGTASKTDIKEVAVFCAKYSQNWRDNKEDVMVHVFRGCDIYKDVKMKLGTFGVKKFDVVRVKKSEILKFERELEKKN